MEAFTKPSAILAATEASPFATFPPTQSPKRCIRSSISTLSPIMAPSTKLQMVMMMLLVFIAICKPITTMHKAMPLIMVCCHFSGKPRFKTTPTKEPTTIAAQFIIVPKPGITLPPHLKLHVQLARCYFHRFNFYFRLQCFENSLQIFGRIVLNFNSTTLFSIRFGIDLNFSA